MRPPAAAAYIRMNGIKQALLVAASVAALTIVALAAYFLFAYPSFISLIGFFVIVPVFLILGLGFFRIARNSNQMQKEDHR